MISISKTTVYPCYVVYMHFKLVGMQNCAPYTGYVFTIYFDHAVKMQSIGISCLALPRLRMVICVFNDVDKITLGSFEECYAKVRHNYTVGKKFWRRSGELYVTESDSS